MLQRIVYMLAAILAISSAAHAEMKITPTSPRLGQIFPDNEPVQFSVQVTGAKAGEPVTVGYAVTETEAPYKTQDTIPVPMTNGDGVVLLPLKLPNRGHYEVALMAASPSGTVKANTTIGVVFPPAAKPDPASALGVMYTPPVWWGRKDYEKSADDAAENLHILGVSWVRTGYGGYSYGEVKIEKRDGKPFVTCDPYLERLYIKAIRKQNINIMTTMGAMPKALSSRPNETATVRDAGELWGRVKPRDYAEWDSMITNLVASFKNDISCWEIENEVNQPDLGYWGGTPEELLEFVAHTSKAIRAGNPAAKILGCGFVHTNGITDKLLAGGITKNFDMLSLHYVNYYDELQQWHDLLKKHKIEMPIWCSEERFELPTISLANGVGRSFDFMQVNLAGPAGEGDYGGLCNSDYTVRTRGVEFSVASHILGGAKAVESHKLGDDYLAVRFSQAKENIIVLTRLKEKTSVDKLILVVEPVDAKTAITLTNRYGRSEPLTVKNGQIEIALQNRATLFIHSAKSLKFVNATH